MKKTLLLLSLFTCLNIISAQVISVTPNPAIFEEVGLNLDFESELHNQADMKNEGTEETEYAWIKTVESAPEEWDFGVYDINQGYFPQIDTSPVALQLEGNQEGMLNVFLNPNGVAGCGTVRMDIALWNDAGNHEIIHSTYYEYYVNNPDDCLSSLEDTPLKNVNIYPNPTTNSFKIRNLDNIPEVNKIAIFNLMGKQVKSFSSNISEYNIEDLPAGLYSVGIINTQRGVLKTMRMTKMTHD